MQMFVYVVLAAVIYLLLADRTDRAIEREMMKRRPGDSRLGLVEDFDVRPDLGPRYGRLLHHLARKTPAPKLSGTRQPDEVGPGIISGGSALDGDQAPGEHDSTHGAIRIT